MNRSIVTLSLILVACWNPPRAVEPDKHVDPDPILEPGVEPAVAACKRFEELSCKSRDGRSLWEPTPGGIACADVFRNAEKNKVDLHPACIAKMTTCEDRDACTSKE